MKSEEELSFIEMQYTTSGRVKDLDYRYLIHCFDEGDYGIDIYFYDMNGDRIGFWYSEYDQNGMLISKEYRPE